MGKDSSISRSDYGKKVDEAEAQMLTTAIALKKAIKEYNIEKIVNGAYQF